MPVTSSSTLAVFVTIVPVTTVALTFTVMVNVIAAPTLTLVLTVLELLDANGLGSAVAEPMVATLETLLAVPGLATPALTTTLMGPAVWPAVSPVIVQVTAVEQVQPLPPARTKVVP